ncbi:MAG: PhzF family phenazine biosynthesis protein [Planctomycetaceae bacterium]
MILEPPIFVVDAFCDGPFSGNPAAVCLLDKAVDERWMQQVAAEMNLSETAFVVPQDGDFGLRWFTPVVEVDLCGHATLAAAHALWREARADRKSPIRFHTRSGVLTCTLEEVWRIGMDFPAEPAAATEPPDGLAAALGAELAWVGRNRFDLLVEVSSADDLRRLHPDFARLCAIECRGVIVTARSDDGKYDFQSRFFAPRVGVNEDPVCGSAHCALGPYWAPKLGKTRLRAMQVGPRRGYLWVATHADRVELLGCAVTTLSGTLSIPLP